jgi:DEAD/DEAH box helicase domain-containing protein
MLQDFIQALKESADYRDILAHYQYVAAQEARYADDVGLPEALTAALQRLGIARLYSHQGEALEAIREGKHILVTTPTASGKTMIYNLPVAESLLEDPEGHALYLFPLKALEQDQLKALNELNAGLPSPFLRTAIYDGDTPQAQRQALRARPPHVVISNPDMLHLGLMPNHHAWASFFSRLKFVVIDEVHTYRGIMGSHMAQVLRRLRRICAHYGARPRFLLCSATMAKPEEFIRNLTGLEVEIITESGAPQSGRHYLFLNPPGSAPAVAAQIFAQAIRKNLATICFTQARKLTELIHVWSQRLAPELRRYISSYRAGFLPEERREIETALSSGKMRGVISTSALEMGIDIGGLDVCLLVGYPGTMVTTRQRAGRVGRAGRDSLIVLVAQADALDQYFIKYPQEFFGRPLEAAIVDPDNPFIVKAHLPCAAQELPLEVQESVFDLEFHEPLLSDLAREGRLLLSAAGHAWFARSRFPQKEVSIRGMGESFTIFKTGQKRPLGSVDGVRALRECHPGAVYLHKAQTYGVEKLDLERRNVWVQPVEPNYFTRIQTDKDTEILEVLETREVAAFKAHTGRLKVTERFLAYEKRRLPGQELLGVASLDLPPQVFETVGMWLEIPDGVKNAVYGEGRHFMGGIHALEHALISMFPLFALADRYDIGGIAHPAHPQVGRAAVFIYDGYPGGVGLAARAYEILEDLLRRTRELVSGCPCEDGCPSCIHSPKCGSGNKPLDKEAALQVAEMLLGIEEITPAAALAQGPEPPPLSPPPPATPITVPWMAGRKMGFLDLETCCSAADVGGWGQCHRMGVSLAVLEETRPERVTVYREADLERLAQRLKDLDLVVGFNIKRFDYRVLQPYTQVKLADLPTLDILEELHAYLGHRISLGHLVEKTLGEAKTGDGLMALELYAAGRWEELEAYCRQDVYLTRRLFEFGAQEGYLLYQHRQGALVRAPVDWREERLFPRP